jgi:hypothetical protein
MSTNNLTDRIPQHPDLIMKWICPPKQSKFIEEYIPKYLAVITSDTTRVLKSKKQRTPICSLHHFSPLTERKVKVLTKRYSE